MPRLPRSFILLLVAFISTRLFGVSPANDKISLAWEAAPRTVDPRYATDANSQYLSALVHCSLVGFDQDGNTTPSLAKEWKWKSPTLLSIKLNGAAKFSDGKPVTSTDVKATYDFFKREKLKNPSPLSGTFKTVVSIATPDATTVELTLSEADSGFVTNLMVGILPAALAGEEMYSDPTKLVNCGPFILEKIDASALTLQRNANYTLGSKAKSSAVEIKIVKDELTRFAKLQKGEVDVVQNVISRDKVEQIAKQYPNLKVIKRPGLNVTYLGFNLKDPTLANPKVRKAIAMAIDRKVIIEYILKGMAVEANGMLTPADPYQEKSISKINFDPKGAEKLLDEAGFKGGKDKPRLELTYKTTTDLTRINIAKAIASQLKKVGIKVDVQSLEWGKFKADVEKGQVQLWSLSWVGFKDPDIYRFAFSTENFPPHGANRGWYSNKKLDELLKKAKTTTDTATRKKLYGEAQQIVAEDLPYVFLWHEETFAVMNKSLKNYDLFADGRLNSLINAHK